MFFWEFWKTRACINSKLTLIHNCKQTPKNRKKFEKNSIDIQQRPVTGCISYCIVTDVDVGFTELQPDKNIRKTVNLPQFILTIVLHQKNVWNQAQLATIQYKTSYAKTNTLEPPATGW